MARANRHYIPGQVWHITHRCHKKEFLLKFARDRRRWLHWLFEAKKRFGLQVLNYAVTSNHVHLLVVDTKPEVVAKSIQLIAGRTAQEFNQRKNRKGAFWEDRYHATAIERNEHLVRCLVYIDLNMVRAGVVTHPAEWEMNGYNEIQNPPDRYAIIDRHSLFDACGFPDYGSFAEQHRKWVEDALKKGMNREGHWTESIAVGSSAFITDTQRKMGCSVKGRKLEEQVDGASFLREDAEPYHAHFTGKSEVLSPGNAFFWDDYDVVPVG
ncbi:MULTISPECIES: transposase [Geobacter]|uniref:transposase n=1 Tax=Geobacter TaxID=28231 RepID=UPI002573EBE7|nr:transposase [Geobacter sulfurreducens]BEH10478.1 transposase [Geobacter sulfurreducens subsp. ethanolicus]BET57934.1 transposase [Geobacter sp. 60473]